MSSHLKTKLQTSTFWDQPKRPIYPFFLHSFWSWKLVGQILSWYKLARVHWSQWSYADLNWLGIWLWECKHYINAYRLCQNIAYVCVILNPISLNCKQMTSSIITEDKVHPYCTRPKYVCCTLTTPPQYQHCSTGTAPCLSLFWCYKAS